MAKKTPTPPPKPRRGDTDKKAAAGGPHDPVNVWTGRLVRANKDYEEWAKEYEVDRLSKYYLGKQWAGLAEDQRKSKYVINMVFATLETQLPTLMFSKPKVSVEPRPTRAQDPASDAPGRASLLEATLQTFVDDRELHFTFETTMALRRAYARFGMVEVGYTADYIDNPNADKPLLRDNSDEPMLDGEGHPITQPKKLRQKESLFLKDIPAQHVRVWPGRNQLLANDWVAYYEWHLIEDVKNNPAYQHTEELKATGNLSSSDPDTDTTTVDPEHRRHEGQVKLWKIWDLRKKERIVHAEGQRELLQAGKPFKYLPLAPLKFYEIEDLWYPLPPIFNWLSPQDEINETREMQKIHRRRAIRRYMREPGVKATEWEKLETGDDMVCIEVPQTSPPPVMPIPDADISPSNSGEELARAKDDFNQVAGVSGEARGVPQSDTATQANIINVREQIRESRTRTLVAEWLADIVRLMMLTIKDKMQGPMVVKMNQDPFDVRAKAPAEPGAQGAATALAAGAPGSPDQPGALMQQAWKEIHAEDLGDVDFDVKVDIASLSPVAEDAQRQQWNVVLQLLTNPQIGTYLFMPNPLAPTEPSPMLRKTLWLNGIKNDSEVREIWRIGQAAMAQAAAAAQAKQTADTQPDPPKISLALKGEDLHDPTYGPAIAMMFAQAEGMRVEAAMPKTPPAAPPVTPAGAPSGPGIAPLAKPGPQAPTGTPATGPVIAGT